MTTKKVYLGDAVYADIDDMGRLVLTTNNGFQTTNEIIFELEVLGYLLDYVKSHTNVGCLTLH